MGYRLISTSIIFLLVTWYLDAETQVVDVPQATYITAFNISSWLMVVCLSVGPDSVTP